MKAIVYKVESCTVYFASNFRANLWVSRHVAPIFHDAIKSVNSSMAQVPCLCVRTVYNLVQPCSMLFILFNIYNQQGFIWGQKSSVSSGCLPFHFRFFDDTYLQIAFIFKLTIAWSCPRDKKLKWFILHRLDREIPKKKTPHMFSTHNTFFLVFSYVISVLWTPNQNRPFELEHFDFPITDHVTVLWRRVNCI